nr:hypothetical protein GCM10025699_60570 [Microbacterium flavescens]
MQASQAGGASAVGAVAGAGGVVVGSGVLDASGPVVATVVSAAPGSEVGVAQPESANATTSVLTSTEVLSAEAALRGTGLLEDDGPPRWRAPGQDTDCPAPTAIGDPDRSATRRRRTEPTRRFGGQA